MRLLIRSVLLCLVVTAAATVSATAGAGARGRPTPTPTPTPPASQPPSAAALKAQANQAAARYAEAHTTYERLGDQVNALEKQVADIEARLSPLRLEVTRQAVALYQGDVAVAAVTHLEAAVAMLQSDRAAHLVADLSARKLPAIETLLAAKQGLRDRQADLEARRREQDATMASLTAQREQISVQLDALAAALPARDARRSLPQAARSAPALGQRVRGAGLPTSFVCPIDGPVAFTDDFGAPRGGGRRHMGNDMLSPRGTPNVAVVNGTIDTRPWAGGGVTIFLDGDDGNTYVYMHLLRIEGAVPRRVSQGEVIGQVGSTGHSFGYHTHFEYHPGGGDAVSPYPLLSAAC
ncbi:MAG TPA: peptidoglycan DD-metalloendopeptidase family protein [Acidimicrobiia bacterium]|nr:peptidoglycan DD-metalloendopeptidase family protein [Acidimicrobiia bacterium]